MARSIHPRRLFLCLLPLQLLLLFAAWHALAKKKHRSLLVNDAKPSEESAFDRGIVTEHLNYKSVLFEHSRHWQNVTHRHFSGNVLAYVTPWNGKGYDVALKFRQKFTHVSPVWYQLKGLRAGPELGGRDGINSDWAKKLKANGAPVKLVPRFNIEGDDVRRMLENEKHEARAIDLVVTECLEQEFDGVVLEAWSSWAQAGVLSDAPLRNKALGFVKRLSQALQAAGQGMEAILVVPPPGRGGHSGDVFSAQDLTALAPFVAGFSLMTYDFSSPYNPGPNAPLKWVQMCLMYLLPHVKPQHVDAYRNEPHYGRELRSVAATGADEGDEIAARVLLGLNFYGNKFQRPQGGGPIVGHEYLNLLDKYRPSLKWDADAGEHRFTITTKTGTAYDVYYPTLKSIADRLDEARAWGTGISIWEIGQGLDFFYDLL